jgi:hypothetical protein
MSLQVVEFAGTFMPRNLPIPDSQLPPVANAIPEVVEMAERLRVMRWTFAGGIVLIIPGQFKPLAAYFHLAFPWITAALGLLLCVASLFWVFKWSRIMIKSDEKKFAYLFGVAFIIVLMVVALLVPNPTNFQYTVFRIVLALAAAGVAAMIPGFLQLTVANWIRAGGALAIFVIVFFYSPAALVANPR